MNNHATGWDAVIVVSWFATMIAAYWIYSRSHK